MVVLASWDDGSYADLRMAELMEKYNIPTTFYWPVKIGMKTGGSYAKWLTESDCKDLAKRFTIGSHSYTHQPMNKLNVPQLCLEITDSRKYWQDLLGQPIDSFAYPKSSSTSLIRALVKGAGYKTARTMAPGFLSLGDDDFMQKCTVQIAIDRIEYANKSWELFADEMIEKSSSESIFHIFGNSWEVDTYGDWENLDQLLQKICNVNL